MNPHDVGGSVKEFSATLDLTERSYEYWERGVHAVMVSLVSKEKLTVDEMRRGIEALPARTYKDWGYYEKWAASMVSICIERGIFSEEQFTEALGYEDGEDATAKDPRFQPGAKVRVKLETSKVRWRKPHLRTPGYIFGATGVIERHCGAFGDPEFLAYRGKSTTQHLYRVRFRIRDIFVFTPVFACEVFTGLAW